MLKTNFSHSIDLNVFGSSRNTEQKKYFKSRTVVKIVSSKLIKFERLLERKSKNPFKYKSNNTETLQITCSDIAERISKLEKPLQDITEQLKKISKSVDTISKL
ncbi:unnamed protein product [Macrosiphum euphorbiae]|uniref:Uncharacterized protein n=1 Tax=Macrosiphum euphorbiae TaxID=13131 RepID=A0AAV0YCT9_9HEMI|nr:unnamed protein product [Macrosiphum euphorbiae]